MRKRFVYWVYIFTFGSAHVYFRSRLIRPRLYKMHALVTKASSISFMIRSYMLAFISVTCLFLAVSTI